MCGICIWKTILNKNEKIIQNSKSAIDSGIYHEICIRICTTSMITQTITKRYDN